MFERSLANSSHCTEATSRPCTETTHLSHMPDPWACYWLLNLPSITSVACSRYFIIHGESQGPREQYGILVITEVVFRRIANNEKTQV